MYHNYVQWRIYDFPLGIGHKHYILQNFLKNPMKFRRKSVWGIETRPPCTLDARMIQMRHFDQIGFTASNELNVPKQ